MSAYENEYILKNGEPLIIRSPREDDAQGLLDLMKTVDQETKFLAREPGELSFTLEQEKEFVRNTLANENGRFLVAQLEGEIVGSVSVGIVMNNRRFLHRAALGIVVKQACWGKGIGKRLMEECIHWCKEKGIEQLELDVVSGNERGIALYESFGFKAFGTKKNALKYADGTYADETFMILFLK